MSMAAHRCVRDTLVFHAGIYTDDFFVFGSRDYVCKAMHDFTVDAESRLGMNAVKAEKTL